MVFQNPYMHQYYIYSNLKIEFRPYEIEIPKKKKKRQVQKHHKCSSPSKSSFNFSHELLGV
jgi:hypothetical protein